MEDGDGRTYPARSVMCRLRDLKGEYEEDDGSEDVKYAGSSGSESSEGYCFGNISVDAKIMYNGHLHQRTWNFYNAKASPAWLPCLLGVLCHRHQLDS